MCSVSEGVKAAQRQKKHMDDSLAPTQEQSRLGHL